LEAEGKRIVDTMLQHIIQSLHLPLGRAVDLNLVRNLAISCRTLAYSYCHENRT